MARSRIRPSPAPSGPNTWPPRPRSQPPVPRPPGSIRRLPPMLELVFWAAAGLLVYTHVGYPLLLRLLARPERRPPTGGELPSVSLIVAAHDEEDVIDRRV